MCFRKCAVRDMKVVKAMSALKSMLKDFGKICFVGFVSALLISSIAQILSAKSSTKPLKSSKESQRVQPSDSSSLDSKAKKEQEKISKNIDEIEVIHGDEESLQQMSKHQKEKELYFLRGRYYQLLYEKSQELKNKTKHGWFAGVSLGTSQMEINKNRGFGEELNPFAFGINGGYMRFLGAAPMGVRVYWQYLAALNASPNIPDSVSSHLFSFNIDMVGDKAIGGEEGYYLGVFIGMGAGVNLYKQSGAQREDKITIGPVLNVGVSATLKYHHRIELGIKTPPNISNQASYFLGTMYITSYQYLF
ncbi:outer membrane beta-barrel protein [Helicobacter sp. MIT 01-3238]|uniref:outer membrane beta-barrel protein n=1 Tax=Helicobacter sp. MIT 01-3238 TaxID=398627 RepID=UPI000E1EC246|nr:outer membrane beta-barrel protein [Helicobacter sp. MIT 01-3238]RDU53069.1 hypothetical protein CQA40_05930 [Helicobacter sp. MIT 01-3238]